VVGSAIKNVSGRGADDLGERGARKILQRGVAKECSGEDCSGEGLKPSHIFIIKLTACHHCVDGGWHAAVDVEWIVGGTQQCGC
jgi:hypothetical protein